MTELKPCTCEYHFRERRISENEFYQMAVVEAQRTGEVSTLLIQQRHLLGYGMARKLINRMAADGIATPPAPGGHWQVTQATERS